jgi:CheY-like chemotaxis protein
MRTQDCESVPLIIIADDDEDDRCLLKSILELKGFDVIEAADGQEAIDMATEWLPDLLLIELKLPVVSGFTVIRRVRKHADLRDTPIIAVSVNRPTCHSRLALAAGCTAHLEKPMDLDQLDALIDRLLPGERPQWASMLVH